MFEPSQDVLRQLGVISDPEHDTDSITVNINTSPEYTPVFQEDIAPPIPDTKEGAFSFILNICWWAVYIAFKLAGYAVLIWFVWTVLTA